MISICFFGCVFKARAAKGEFTPRDSTFVNEQRSRQIEKNGTNPPKFVTNPPIWHFAGGPASRATEESSRKKAKKGRKKNGIPHHKTLFSFAQF